jgi:hypothetical protein
VNSAETNTNNPGVLLTDTTRYSSAPRLAVALVKAGIAVSAVCPIPRHPLLKVRGVRQTLPYSGLRPLDSLSSAIEAIKPEIVIPCDDRGVGHLHELHSRARGRGAAGHDTAALIERSLGPPESYPVVSGRFDILRLARQHGLPVPEMSLVRTAEDLDRWHAGHKFPWVLKADGTSGGRGVWIVHSVGEAERSLVKMTQRIGAAQAVKRLVVNRDSFWLRPWWNCSKPSVIVQSYVRGRPANCAFFCRRGRVLAGLGVEVVSTRGPTGPATIVRLVNSETMTRCADRIASALGLTGFYGLDFVIDEDTGEPCLIEMNPRSTPLCHMQLGGKRDLIGALSAQLSDRPPGETEPVITGDMIAYFPQAWQDRSEFLGSSFHDVPWEEPDLIRELLQPWPDRTFLVRAFNYVDRMKGEEPARFREPRLEIPPRLG